jgi:hypothetical protein
VFLFLGIGFTFAQTDPIQEIKSQAIQIDSLKKQINLEKNNYIGVQNNILQLRDRFNQRGDTIKLLSHRLLELEKSINDQRTVETQLKLKRDSIVVLKNDLRLSKNEIISEREKGISLAKKEKELGKNEIIEKINQKYMAISFDELIGTTTKSSVEKDLQILNGGSEVSLILENLIIFHDAKYLLSQKFDKIYIDRALKNLDSILVESMLTKNLQKKIQEYEMLNEGIKVALSKINQIDQNEVVKGMPTEIQNSKLGKILTELSSFTFNYDLKENEYPYLEEIIFEIMRRKHPNPDADIADLLLKI